MRVQDPRSSPYSSLGLLTNTLHEIKKIIKGSTKLLKLHHKKFLKEKKAINVAHTNFNVAHAKMTI